MWKGHATLLRAWKLAGEPGLLVIAGGPPPGGKGVDVPALTAELGIGSSVNIIGETRDVAALMKRAHYVIVPSDAPEPFGLVAIEALAMARPVIASSSGGPGEIVRDGVDGHLFENRNFHQLATILNASSVEESCLMSEQARLRFEECYSLDAFYRRLASLWAEMGLRTNNIESEAGLSS
jgi:glycosyltransferase involved in cell wall biosynthesis